MIIENMIYEMLQFFPEHGTMILIHLRLVTLFSDLNNLFSDLNS